MTVRCLKNFIISCGEIMQKPCAEINPVKSVFVCKFGGPVRSFRCDAAMVDAMLYVVMS